MTGACQTCGTPLPPKTWKGRDRKFCSERCRKRQYDLACVDCGIRVNGTTPSKIKPGGPRCLRCAAAIAAEKRRFWTVDVVIARIREWDALYGEPPAGSDWAPNIARYLNDPERARRFEDAGGHWPWLNIVVALFGSWNAAITAAGFTPRASTGGGGNEQRKRRYRVAAA